MNTFNYQDIEQANIKDYISNSFKLFFRKPLFSFIPLILIFSISFFILKTTFIVFFCRIVIPDS